MAKEKKLKECPICGGKLSFAKQTIEGVKICGYHMEEAGIKLSEILSRVNNPFTLKEIKERINTLETDKEKFEDELDKFTANKRVGNFVAFDDDRRKWAILSAIRGKIKQVYSYEDIINFELMEDGNSVASGGLGRALVGGALFGGAGAIVGGVTGKKKSKGICNSLRLKVTINNISNPVVYINFIETKMKKDGLIYKQTANAAQECLSVFQLICDRKDEVKKEPHTTSSAADEIMKFKNLLDAGAITQEEYETKKKELLGI